MFIISFFKIAPWLVVVPTYKALSRYSGLTPALKHVLYYLILASLTQAAAFAFWYQKANNMPLLHVYTLLEFFFVASFYHHALGSLLPANSLRVLILFFSLFSILNSLFIQNIYQFNSYASALKSLLVLVLALLFLLKKIREQPPTTGSSVASESWINSGFLIYFSGALVLFSFAGLLPRQQALQLNVWSLHLFLLIILYILLTIAFWKPDRKN